MPSDKRTPSKSFRLEILVPSFSGKDPPAINLEPKYNLPTAESSSVIKYRVSLFLSTKALPITNPFS